MDGRSAVYSVLADLEERLEKAAAALEDQANGQGSRADIQLFGPEYYRLIGKSEGARLAVSYLREVRGFDLRR